MYKIFSTIAAFLIIAHFQGQNLYAQSSNFKTRIGGSFALGMDAYKLADPGRRIDKAPVGSLAGTIYADVEFTDVFSAGGGLIFKKYASAVDFKNAETSTTDIAMSTLQIPLHLRARLNFGKHESALYGEGGAAVAFNLNRGVSSYITTHSAGISTIMEYTDISYDFKKAFPLLFLGAGVDFPIILPAQGIEAKGIRFGFSAQRFFGFSKVMQADIGYTVDGMEIIYAEQSYKGGYWLFNINLIIAIEH